MDVFKHNGEAIAFRHKRSLGRTIVFANSLGSVQSIWDDVIDHLPNGYGILTYDLRGHGLSGEGNNTSIEAMADDIAALIEHLGLQDVLFCGVSIGGMIGQVLAAKRPELLTGAILCNTSSKIGTAERWNERIEAVEANGVAGIANKIISNWFGSQYEKDNPDLLSLHENMVARSPDKGYLNACKAIRDADLKDFAQTISVPTLCIGGGEDKSVPLQQVEQLAARIPNAEFICLETVGHLPCLETPASLARAIEDFDPVIEPAQARGMAIRRKVLGNEHVDRAEAGKSAFDEAFQTLITQGAWGTVWASHGLSHRERSLLTLALLAAQGNFEEIPMHVRATIRTGASEQDIAEAFQHVAIYAGVPRANHALKLAKATLSELKDE